MNHLNELILSNLFLVFTWLAYDLVFSRIRLFQANRFFLLVGSVISVVLPWLPWHLRIGQPEGGGFPIPLKEKLLPVPAEIHVLDGPTGAGLSWTEGIALAYVSVVVILLVISIVQVIRLVHGARSRKATRCDGITVVPMDRSCSAYSFFRTVYFPEPFDPDCREIRVILEHEKVHIRQWHTIDNLVFTLLRILFFYNPAVYFLTSRIRLVHEYIADRATAGTETTDYSHLLIRHQFLVPGLWLMHSFNTKSFLTRRITMLSKIKHTRRAGWNYLLAAPVLAAMILLSGWSATAQDQGKKSKEEIAKMAVEKELTKAGFSQADIDEIKLRIDGKIRESKPDAKKDTGIDKRTDDAKNSEEVEDQVVFQIVEVMPEFKGGGIEQFREWVQSHVKYPKIASENKISGTVYVTFVVGKDGKTKWVKVLRSVDPVLDDEVVRVVKSSPDWKPGLQRDNPVNVSFSLPVKFVPEKK